MARRFIHKVTHSTWPIVLEQGLVSDATAAGICLGAVV